MGKAIKKVIANRKNNSNNSKPANQLNKLVREFDYSANRTKNNTIHCSLPYLKALLQPEYAIGAKVPRQLSKETISLSRHVTVPITTSALGTASIIFSPFFLKEDIIGLSGLLVNNAATYDGVSVFGVGHTAQIYRLLIPQTNISSYRLVSAAMHVVPQMSLTTSTGKIGGSVTDLIFTPIAETTTTNAYNNTAIFANVESQRPYAEADCCVPESLRLVWYPYDVNDLGLYDINNTQDGVAAERENVLVAFITGTPAGAKFNLELFWNFEVTPAPGSILTGMGTACADIQDPIDSLVIAKSDASRLAHAYVSTQHSHSTVGRNFALSVGGTDLKSSSKVNIGGKAYSLYTE